MNYNTSQYSTFALRLASEPPFADTQTNTADPNFNGGTGCGPAYLTPGPPPSPDASTPLNPNHCTTTISNNYAVNPNYRIGYVQIWNLGIQRTAASADRSQHRLHRLERHAAGYGARPQPRP